MGMVEDSLVHTSSPLEQGHDADIYGAERSENILGPTLVSPKSGRILKTPLNLTQRNRLKPERWTNPTKEMEAAILTFGGASRPCIGQQLAMMELRLLAATLFMSCAGAELADSCTDESMEFVEYLAVRPKANKCELQKRR
ncbi:hypothetical protein ABW20_dc0108743 [Dactylellina cionopaga]|nr:hypothetical protein ABW20_dc0108743 [Dactylellina cionopaga]